MQNTSWQTLAHPGIRLRRAGGFDAAQLADLAQRAFKDVFTDRIPELPLRRYLQDNYSEDAVRQQLRDHRVFWIAAQSDGVLLGCAQLSARSPSTGLSTPGGLELSHVFVEPGHTGQGIGGKMMRWVLQFARGRGFSHLWTRVPADDIPVIRFYKSWQFEVTDMTPLLLMNHLEPALVMARGVADS